MTTQLFPRGLVSKALFAPKKDIVGTFIIDEICPKPLSAAKAYLHREIKAILCLKLYLPQSDTIEIFLFSFIITLAFSFSLSIPSYAKQSVEEIIKGRKAMFSENYQNAKQISILLKQKKIEEAKPLMKKISDNYIKLLDYFPDNTKEGFKTEALPSIWENKDEFNALMQKASDDMIKLAKAIDTAEDLRAVQKELMWSNCSACHNRFRAEH